MKKLYSVLMMSILAVVLSFSAKADINVTLKIDDASRLTGYVQYMDDNYNYVQTDFDMTQFTGEGSSFSIPSSYGYVYIYATDGNTITSAMNETTGSDAGIGSYVYFYVSADCTLAVTSADLESTRTATCTVNVDDASKVKLAYSTGASIALVNGENTVKFNPNGETPFQINHVNYSESLYAVTLNGETQSDSYGTYYVTVADGDVLDIKAEFPDMPSVLNFSYGENEAEVLGCISVEVNGVAVEDFNGKTLEVKLGQTVRLVGNPDLYNYNYSIYVNGEYTYFYDSYEFTVTKAEYTFEINATKYQTFNVFVTVDNAENVNVYAGYSYEAETIVSGEPATITLSASANCIYLEPTSDCYMTSITVNGTEYGSEYGSSSITVRELQENDQIVVTTGKINRDKTATIWVDDLSAAIYGYGVYRYSDRQYVDLISGEAVTINFDDTDNPYYLSFYQPTVCDIFLNGIYQTPQYEGSTSYYITFADGDAAKVYLAASPEKFAVSFTSTIENAIASVSTDSQVYAAWAEGFTTLNGTEVSFTLTEGIEADVNVAGNTISADENGVYTVVIAADTEIAISEKSGIENITLGNSANNVYNMQGILVAKNANAEQIKALPAGIYIVNGKKVIR